MLPLVLWTLALGAACLAEQTNGTEAESIPEVVADVVEDVTKEADVADIIEDISEEVEVIPEVTADDVSEIEVDVQSETSNASAPPPDAVPEPHDVSGRPLRYHIPTDFSYSGEEYLNITPLKRNNVRLSFNFETNHSIELYPDPEEATHNDVFPKTVGTILQHTQTRELHLRFGQGWYDSEVWGKLSRGGLENGGTGVELWAVIEAESEVDAFERWRQLTNSLSGLFSVSLNFIDSSSTTNPASVFQPDEGLLAHVPLKNKVYLFRSALPREPVSTENLTPFLKMLPTKGKAGIFSLITGKKLFNSEWSSMSVDILTLCDSQCHYKIKQSIDLIKNVPRVLERNRMPIPKPIKGHELRCDTSKKHDAYHCFPLPERNDLDFDFYDLFGRVIHGGALMASTPSKVCANLDVDHWKFTLNSSAPAVVSEDDNEICYELNTNLDYDLRLTTDDSSYIKPLEQPPIYASRSLSGYSQDSGGFRIDLYNPTDEEEDVIVFETIPWFVRLYLHTLTITANDNHSYGVSDNVINSVVQEIIYNPAEDRKHPTHLELLTKIPARSKVKLSVEFDKAMLLYAEYPPDANHGFEIEPVVVSVVDKASRKISYQVRTTTALLTLPTPDFSMPYNVIILTSTVMSLAFGSFFNLLTKKTVTEEESEAEAAKGILAKLKRRVAFVKQTIRQKLGK